MLLPLLLASALHAPARSAPDSLVTGMWQISGEVVGNPVHELCTIKQDGAKLSGSCKNTDAADAKAYDVTGEMKDGKVSFSHGGDYQGQAITLTFSGTAASAKQLAGNIDVQPFGVTGTFTAVPAAATPKP